MDRIHAMQAFASVVEHGGFGKASVTMGVATATVSRLIQQLENQLGVTLLNRTTRQLSMTPDGLHYYESCKRILGDLAMAEATLPGATKTPHGRLRIDISHGLARHVILPAIGTFTAQYPQIQLAVGLDDRVVDLLQENIDCVIRTGIPANSSVLVARTVASFEWVTCATPEYLRSNGTPTRLSDLAMHRAVGYFYPQSTKNMEWTFLSDGNAVNVQMDDSISVNETAAYVKCALNHLGLIRVASYLVEEHLQSGRLVAVLAQFNAPSIPVSVVYPKGNRTSLPVRAFVDWTLKLFAKRAEQLETACQRGIGKAG